jgi:hypothetical protein
MDKSLAWIKDHQIVTFFLVTFVITWGLGFSWSAVLNRHQFMLLPVVFVATCGPGLAGILISATHQYPAETRLTQDILDCFCRGMVHIYPCLPREHEIHPGKPAVTIGGWHVRNCSGPGQLCGCFSLFPQSVRAKLHDLVDPVAWCMGVVSAGAGVVSSLALDFPPHQQPAQQPAHRI